MPHRAAVQGEEEEAAGEGKVVDDHDESQLILFRTALSGLHESFPTAVRVNHIYTLHTINFIDRI